MPPTKNTTTTAIFAFSVILGMGATGYFALRGPTPMDEEKEAAMRANPDALVLASELDFKLVRSGNDAPTVPEGARVKTGESLLVRYRSRLETAAMIILEADINDRVTVRARGRLMQNVTDQNFAEVKIGSTNAGTIKILFVTTRLERDLPTIPLRTTATELRQQCPRCDVRERTLTLD